MILNLGLFLEQSEFLGYSELLTKSNFLEHDPSMSYPLSGLYNLFLIEELDVADYSSLCILRSIMREFEQFKVACLIYFRCE